MNTIRFVCSQSSYFFIYSWLIYNSWPQFKIVCGQGELPCSNPYKRERRKNARKMSCQIIFCDSPHINGCVTIQVTHFFKILSNSNKETIFCTQLFCMKVGLVDVIFFNQNSNMSVKVTILLYSIFSIILVTISYQGPEINC